MKKVLALVAVLAVLLVTLFLLPGRKGPGTLKTGETGPTPTAADSGATAAEPVAAPPAGDRIRFDAKPGSRVSIEGTSTIHNWKMVGKIIGGYLETTRAFASEPGQQVAPGNVYARVEAFIPVRSLASEKDGKPYSTRMDDIAYEKMKEPANKRILYRLGELVLKTAGTSTNTDYSYDSKGELVVAGVTNRIAMPIRVTPLGDDKLKITGNVTVKMTSFGIEPPAPALAGGLIKTGDEVNLSFEWLLGKKAEPVAAAGAETGK
jgi:hypothetical protein